ncbi:MAG: DUF5662 family protein [Eubacterium sp.]|nr:DUF5662 family protein [Eubacterium sp.]
MKNNKSLKVNNNKSLKEKIVNQGWYRHLSTINEHKLEVGKNCFRCGLYLQGILHDLSKYSWTEFSVGAKYYQGNRSPNEAEREDKGYTSSWLHHKGRNKHHLEYWLDYDLNKRDGSVTGMKMPDNYIIEMFCDRVAASKIYHKNDYTDRAALDYYLNGKSKNILHPYTKKKLETLLYMLAEEGEDVAFDYARRYVKGYRRYLKRKKYKKRLNKKMDRKLDRFFKKEEKAMDKLGDSFADKKVKTLKKYEDKYSRRLERDINKNRGRIK